MLLFLSLFICSYFSLPVLSLVKVHSPSHPTFNTYYHLFTPPSFLLLSHFSLSLSYSSSPFTSSVTLPFSRIPPLPSQPLLPLVSSIFYLFPPFLSSNSPFTFLTFHLFFSSLSRFHPLPSPSPVCAVPTPSCCHASPEYQLLRGGIACLFTLPTYSRSQRS